MKHIHILVTENEQQEQVLMNLARELHALIGAPPPQRSAPPTCDEQISSVLLALGMPANLKGFQYLIEAVRLTVLEPGYLTRLTTSLYPAVAERFSATASTVERAIRHAIDATWQRGRVEQINPFFGCRVACREEKPTSGELIAMVSEHIRREQSRQA